MKQVLFCRECKWSLNDDRNNWNRRCVHPIVNSKDDWALSDDVRRGSCAREERGKKWFAQCGMAGKLWEPKE